MNQEEIKIVITGDFAPRLRVNDVIAKGDYASLFGDLLEEIRNADIAITNLESPLCETPSPIRKTGPNLIAPTKSIEALKYAGFNMVTLANNHIMDQGVEGLKSAIKTCKNAGIDYVGVGMNISEAQCFKVMDCKGKKIAFINCCENEWSTTTGDEPGANPLNEVSLYYQIQEAKEQSDYTILIIHGGHETYGLPSPRMKKLYRWFIDLGVDAVIGHHTHCYSGREEYNGKSIIYSLGNFIFDHSDWRDNYWTIGCAGFLKIKGDRMSLDIKPFHQCDASVGIRLYDALENIDFTCQDIKKTQIISDDGLLKKEYDKFLLAQSNMFEAYLEPFPNIIILGLKKLRIICSLLKPSKRLLYQNLIRCESHRDILLNRLKETSAK